MLRFVMTDFNWLIQFKQSHFKTISENHKDRKNLCFIKPLGRNLLSVKILILIKQSIF